MEAVLLDGTGFNIDLAQLLARLHIDATSSDAARIAHLAAQAEALARPKSLHRIAYIDSRTDDGVVINGIAFTSRVLRVNLDQPRCVLPYLATCGEELERWSAGQVDMLDRYWADEIKQAALSWACARLNEHISGQYQLGSSATVSPGSLTDWPIEQQRPLFDLFGERVRDVGVQLTDSFLMIPNKSVSGIRFANEENFASCRLCPRAKCPSRSAQYDKHLYRRKYARC